MILPTGSEPHFLKTPCLESSSISEFKLLTLSFLDETWLLRWWEYKITQHWCYLLVLRDLEAGIRHLKVSFLRNTYLYVELGLKRPVSWKTFTCLDIIIIRLWRDLPWTSLPVSFLAIPFSISSMSLGAFCLSFRWHSSFFAKVSKLASLLRAAKSQRAMCLQ